MLITWVETQRLLAHTEMEVFSGLHQVLLNAMIVFFMQVPRNFTYSEADPRNTQGRDISEWLHRTSVITLKCPPPRGQCLAHRESNVWGTGIRCDMVTGIIVIWYINKDTRTDGVGCTLTFNMMSLSIWSQLESQALSPSSPLPQG